jgi:hypothetical protein
MDYIVQCTRIEKGRYSLEIEHARAEPRTVKYFGQQDSGHPLIRHYSTRLWILRDAKTYENYIIFFFFFTFCDVILCNFLHDVTFTFF